jgi:hypothetical protein
MSDLRFISNSPEFKRAMDSLAPKLFKAAKDGFVELQETWVQRMKKQQFSGYYPGPTRGRKLRARSGALRSSIGGRVVGNKLGSLRAILRVGGGRAGYARLQEEGGTVQAQGRMLTIPLGPALRPNTGTLNPKAVIRREADGYTTGFGPTFILKKGGDAMIMARRPGGSVMPLYKLKSSVKVPPRLGASEKLMVVGKQKLPELSDRLLKVLVETKGAV